MSALYNVRAVREHVLDTDGIRIIRVHPCPVSWLRPEAARWG